MHCGKRESHISLFASESGSVVNRLEGFCMVGGFRVVLNL